MFEQTSQTYSISHCHWTDASSIGCHSQKHKDCLLLITLQVASVSSRTNWLTVKIHCSDTQRPNPRMTCKNLTLNLRQLIQVQVMLPAAACGVNCSLTGWSLSAPTSGCLIKRLRPNLPVPIPLTFQLGICICKQNWNFWQGLAQYCILLSQIYFHPDQAGIQSVEWDSALLFP